MTFLYASLSLSRCYAKSSPKFRCKQELYYSVETLLILDIDDSQITCTKIGFPENLVTEIEAQWRRQCSVSSQIRVKLQLISEIRKLL